MSSLVVVHPGRAAAYGAEELKRAAHRYMFTALSISILVHFSLIGFYYLDAMSQTDDMHPWQPPPRGPVVIVDNGPRIPGIYTPPPETGTERPRQRGRAGIVIPVPDNPLVDTVAYASQDDLRRAVDPGNLSFDIPEYRVPPDIAIPDEAPPDTFIAVEKDPVLVSSVMPAYPPLALKAEVEGRVIVKMWVDRQGKVREVRVVRSTNEIFDDVAVEAAKKFVFTPAYMNNGPVSVWVAYPFRFKLTDAR